ncbi:MAG: glycosyltransferase 87 family protein, partial [Hyphomicrobiales bacterium]
AALFAWIFIAGVVMRLVFLGSQPILEDDYNRYLWDGAVTANGLNPYVHSPAEAAARQTGSPDLDRLASQADAILERINYARLRTVYPPVAEAAFALAHGLKPWSLDAWRLLVLTGDLAIFGLVVLLLQAVGRPLSWVALYWWNPLVVKELHNSAHMDVLVVVGMLAAVCLAVKHRPLWAAGATAFAVGAKLWPFILLPTLLRPWLRRPAVLTAALAVAVLTSAVLLAPILLAKLDSSSGFVAYGTRWQANDALFRAVEWLCLQAAGLFGAAEPTGKLLARALVFAVLLGVIAQINRRAIEGPADVCWRVFITVTALFLLSPTQFPWYYVWLAPFLPLFPVSGLLLLTATLPLYYAYFYLAPRDMEQVFHYGVVLVIWLPVVLLLGRDVHRHVMARGPNAHGATGQHPVHGGRS